MAWLRSLRDTYGYKPVAYAWSEPFKALDEALLFCEINSWLTGRRLVSLPFSDHCEPLVEQPQTSPLLLEKLQQQLLSSRWRYIEIRPVKSSKAFFPQWHTSANYYFHQMDLRPPLGAIFRRFHQSSIQRKIRRAEREGLRYQEGSSESMLEAFYRLLIVTRKRHFVPPQPRQWFLSLMHNFGSALTIRLAYKGDRAIAGMLTIRHKATLYYKYGGSDARFHRLGGMHLLYWNAIQEAKSAGLTSLDLGRSDSDQPGLITFKSRWGSVPSPLTYYRFAPETTVVHAFDRASGLKIRAMKRLCSFTPAAVLPALGELLYKHIG